MKSKSIAFYVELDKLRSEILETQTNWESYTRKLEGILVEVYDYLDVDNEGCSSQEYVLSEKIRKALDG